MTPKLNNVLTRQIWLMVVVLAAMAALGAFETALVVSIA